MANTFTMTPPFPDTHAEFAREIHLQRIFGREHNNALLDDVFWNYSKWRHDLNPHRFDHYHMTVGHIIEKVPRPPPPAPSPMPPVAVVAAPPAVGGMTAGTVPEPASWLLLGVGLVMVALAARGRR